MSNKSKIIIVCVGASGNHSLAHAIAERGIEGNFVIKNLSELSEEEKAELSKYNNTYDPGILETHIPIRPRPIELEMFKAPLTRAERRKLEMEKKRNN